MSTAPHEILRPAKQASPTATPANAADTAALADRAGHSEVLAAPTRDVAAFLADDGLTRQALEGFEDLYADIVHYILRCTHRIWEEGGLGLIYSHYTQNCPIHTNDGTVYGHEAVVAMTAKGMNAYPDLRLVGDDVVWSGDAERGFHTSHRITHVGTNHGWSEYGPPTGQPIRRKAIAHCVVKEGRIVQEWITRDELAAIRALGLDEHRLARELGARDAARRGGPFVGVVGDLQRGRGQASPQMPTEPPDGMSATEWLVVGGLQRIWNERRLDLLGEVFAPQVVVETSTNRRFAGLHAYRAWMLTWLASFSDITITFEHSMVNERIGGSVVATRWRLDGTHSGPGPYGPPTGRRVQVLGFSHHLVQDGHVTAEWSVFDEFAVLKQILTPAQALHAHDGVRGSHGELPS